MLKHKGIRVASLKDNNTMCNWFSKIQLSTAKQIGPTRCWLTD